MSQDKSNKGGDVNSLLTSQWELRKIYHKTWYAQACYIEHKINIEHHTN